MQQEASSTAAGDAQWHGPRRKAVGRFPTKLSTVVPVAPAVTPLGIYPRELKTCAPLNMLGDRGHM